MSQVYPPLVKHPAQVSLTPIPSRDGPTNAGAQFVPRREFIRDHRIASTFALFTISGLSFVRLYSFSDALAASLKALFNRKNIISAVREHKPKHFWEITLEGKPWSNPKSITSEKLIVDIMTIILHHGYIFLSTIDYGREPDDKLAVAFSKPQFIPPPTLQHSNGSAISLNQPVKSPFAISFSSATLLRVIGPPLHSTPAILQAVRGAWPRGVVTEKKVGDATYEFKLKGYKWFQEDTFATDSLHHILTLLASLDTHGFTLLTSLSMTGRSRVKDMWIFTGEHHPDSQPSTPNLSNTDLRREITPQQPVSLVPGPSPFTIDAEKHIPPRHSQTPPAMTNPGIAPEVSGHIRAASDNTPVTSSPLKPQTTTFAKVHNLIRKPSPKKQPPGAFPLDTPQTSQGTAATLNGGPYPPGAKRASRSRLSLVPGQLLRSLSNPSSIGSLDMTGVGAGLNKSADIQKTPDVFYTTDGRPRVASKDRRRSNPYFPAVAAEARPPHAAFFEGREERRSSVDNRIDPRQSPRPSPRPSVTRSSTLPIMSPRQHSSSLSIPRLQIQAPSPIVQHASDRGFRTENGSNASKGPPPIAASRTPTPPLLTPGTFRDSAFSSATGWQSQANWQSTEIPIAWAGKIPELAARDAAGVEQQRVKHQLHSGANGTAREAPPIVNGGAAAPPREERSDAGYKTFPPSGRDQHTTTHDHRHSTLPHRRQRHSLQAPMSSTTLGMLDPSTTQAAATQATESERDSSTSAALGRDTPTKKPAGGRRDTAMSGWVLVNVENPAPSHGRSSAHGKKASSQSPPPSSRPAVRHRRSNSDSGLHRPQVNGPDGPVGIAPAPATMSAAAKTIAMIDAVDAREKEQEKSSTPSGFRRIFHRSKGSGDSESGTPKKKALEGRGTPPATKVTDKRMSVD